MNHKLVGNLDYQLFDDLRDEFCHKKFIPTYTPFYQPKGVQNQTESNLTVVYVPTGDFINANRIEHIALLKDLVPMWDGDKKVVGQVSPRDQQIFIQVYLIDSDTTYIVELSDLRIALDHINKN